MIVVTMEGRLLVDFGGVFIAVLEFWSFGLVVIGCVMRDAECWMRVACCVVRVAWFVLRVSTT
jgi:hypothetical protein